LESALDSSFSSMLRGTTSFTTGVHKLFFNLGDELIVGVFHKMVSAWVSSEVTKLSESTMVQSALKALHLQSLVTAKTTDAAEALADIDTKAAQAAAGAYAATVAIPYIGPIIAPAAAAEAEASVMAFASQVASAAGGMMVDKDQLALVHKNEMVLPSHISQGIQERVLGQDLQSQEAGSRGDSHYHINAHDSASFKDFLSKKPNRDAMAKAMRRAYNGGNKDVRH
jgi:hypothetical protein